jgi:hypothetical protein
VLLDIKINSETVEPLAAIVHKDNAYYVSRCPPSPCACTSIRTEGVLGRVFTFSVLI